MVRHTNKHDKFTISFGELICQELSNDKGKNSHIKLQIGIIGLKT